MLTQKKLLFFLSALVFISLGVFIYHKYSLYKHVRGSVSQFDPARDTEDILNLFKTDRYWLLANAQTSPRDMLKHRSPYPEDSTYKGKLYIKVLREAGEFVGFVSYYRQTFKDWRLLFVAVSGQKRGQHAGETLMLQALEDMKQLGAYRVILTTRTENFRAQKLYTRLGFVEYERDDQYVQFQKKIR